MTVDIEQALAIIKSLIGIIVLIGGALGWSVNNGMNQRQEITYTQAQVTAIAEAYAEQFCGR